MKYILVTKGGKEYKVFLKDVQKIIVKEKTIKPRVPDFDYQSINKRMSIETATSEEEKTDEGVMMEVEELPWRNI